MQRAGLSSVTRRCIMSKFCFVSPRYFATALRPFCNHNRIPRYVRSFAPSRSFLTKGPLQQEVQRLRPGGHIDPVRFPEGLVCNTDDDNQAVKGIRKFIIDIVRQHGDGHGGSAIGMAPLGVALWKYVMRYNPANPEWFDRDRFVLSNGHAAILLYTMLHVSGYSHMTVDEIKMYSDPKKVDKSTGTWPTTHCPAHPEIEVPGVEVTTGPLGQGVANAVGLAIASKNLAASFNKDCNVINSHVFCVTGDGCLQEGVANEAMAIAGHFGLDNLTLLYDNNQVTCDGPLEWTVSEDTNAKVQALGWHVIDVFDGDSSVESIVKAIAAAKLVKGKPTFVNIRTTIGYGTGTAGTFRSHHGTYTDEDAAKYATDGINTTHTLSERTKAYFASIKDRGQTLERDWNTLLERYATKYPKESKALKLRREGILNSEGLLADIQIPKAIQAARVINGRVFNTLMNRLPQLFAGGADLWEPNRMDDNSQLNFDRAHPEGRIVRYGIREHAMVAVSNGIAAYAPGCFIPVTATFLMFYLYAAPAVRMGAQSGLQAIHVATHDSIGEGQDGPTHQPVEVDSLFRAMPNLLFVRPADAEEVIGAWAVVLGARGTPSIISLARDPALFAVENTDRRKVARGGYVVAEKEGALVTLVSCGSELQFAAEAAKVLNAEGIPTRVVSMPCIKIFEGQDRVYQDAVLSDSKHIISVEAYVSSMWARLCTVSIAMDSYGFSGEGDENFARFGFDADGIVRKVKAHIQGPNKDRRRWTLLK